MSKSTSTGHLARLKLFFPNVHSPSRHRPTISDFSLVYRPLRGYHFEMNKMKTGRFRVKVGKGKKEMHDHYQT